MFRKIIAATLVLTFALAGCGSQYRVEREGMPDELKTKMEQQIEAGEAALAATEDATDKIIPLLDIAFAYDQLGRFDKAIPYYEQMLEIDPVSFQALNNLGVIYEEVGEYRKAAEHYGKLLNTNPSNMEVLSDTVRALMAMGHFVDAQDTLEKFTEYNQNASEEMLTFISSQYEKIRQAIRDRN
ncbi:MAG: tetratricopeptide repeat protein [Patescibacteria group bacterium]